MSQTLFYNWKRYSCAYHLENAQKVSDSPALLLIHPIGVGLSGQFWQPFCQVWQETEQPYTIYNPDLLGCGQSAMPSLAYYPEDWAAQLSHFIEKVIQKPVILVVQGALFPVAIKLVPLAAQWIKGIVLSGPPSWPLITTETNKTQQKLLWNLLFNSPVGLGNLFYRYARRRQFLASFSTRQLFASEKDVDSQWLDTLQQGAENLQSRYAVFSFLAGFWRENYESQIKQIKIPTMAVFGEQASSISKEGEKDTASDRLTAYVNHLPQGEGKIIAGRNVLPYESTQDFVEVVGQFSQRINH
ncbi:MAG: alpha/beta fold hydrolase [Microcystaceae cyanobacterium]